MFYNFKNKEILIFSDTHLKCDFKEKWFKTIKPYIQKANIIIISGDFWEDKNCKFEKFIQTEWRKKLFPLLKEKTILIHGNNDDWKFVKNKNDLRLFSKANFYKLNFISGKQKFHIEHGHLVNQNSKSISKFLIKKLKRNIPKIYYFLKESGITEKFFYKQLRKDFYKKFEEISDKNQKIINIYGHIHYHKHNLKNGNYYIVGSSIKKLKLLIIKDGKIKTLIKNFDE